VEELVEAYVAGPGVPEPWDALSRLTAMGEQDRAAVLLAEVKRAEGKCEEAWAALSGPPVSGLAPLVAEYELAQAAISCEMGRPPARLPQAAAPDARWTAVFRHRIARALHQPAPAPALQTLVVHPWEHLLVTAIRELVQQ
jgi:hypothetical protein